MDDGFDEAFDELFPRAVRLGTRLLGDRAAAEDLTQATFLSMVRSRSRFDRSARLRPWLYTIAANAARDHLRRRRALQPLNDLLPLTAYVDGANRLVSGGEVGSVSGVTSGWAETFAFTAMALEDDADQGSTWSWSREDPE